MSGPTPVHDLLANVDYQRYIDWVDERIVNQSRWVILAFLLVTALFFTGLSDISSESGTQQFTTGLPSEEAFQDVQREFSPSFSPDTGSTSLIQREQNVLSRRSMLRMLRLQERVESTSGLRVESTASAASLVARELDPTATTLDEQISTIERATAVRVDRAVRGLAASNDRFTGLLSRDFNSREAAASATIGTVTHEVPAGLSEATGQGSSSPLTSAQLRIRTIEKSVGGDITVFGSGIVSQEFGWVLTDSLLITVPAALLFIILFLTVAYRDLADLVLGIFSLFMAIIWTFGFLGLAGIPFNNIMIAVPPLLLAVGIDFGIHAVNRYREERQTDAGIEDAMRITTDQLTVAFFIVTGTTVIGFLSNLTSALPPIGEFGIVAAIGIVFTFLIFGVFLPAAKVELDRLRARTPIPTFSTSPLGSEGGVVARILSVGVVISKRAPALFLLLVLLFSAGAGVYATGVDTSFSQEDFLPPEDNPDFLEELPEPFRPHEYSVRGTLNFLEDNFESTSTDQTTIYIEAPMTRGSMLESIHARNEGPPDTFLREGRQASTESIVSVIQSQARQDPAFAAVVDRNDIDDDGVPEQNLRTVYDALLDSPARDQALNYITEDYTSTRIVYSVESDADQSEVAEDTRTVANRFNLKAVATGQTVVFQAVSDKILESALTSLVFALAGAGIFLVIAYLMLEGSATLGVVNMVPVVVTVALLVASMRALAVPFNAITATILGITIGLGVDYSVHVVHRFADEREQRELVPALERTVRGTGGALLGSMLTTVSGIGVLALAVFVSIQQFGLLTGLSVFYAFLTSVIVLPSVLVIWDHYVLQDNRSVLPLFGIGRATWREPTPTPADVDLPDPTPAVRPRADDGSDPGGSDPDSDLGQWFDEAADENDDIDATPGPDTTESDGPDGAGRDEDRADDSDESDAGEDGDDGRPSG